MVLKDIIIINCEEYKMRGTGCTLKGIQESAKYAEASGYKTYIATMMEAHENPEEVFSECPELKEDNDYTQYRALYIRRI